MEWSACAVHNKRSSSSSCSSSSSLAGAVPRSSPSDERFAEAKTTADNSSAVSGNRNACVNASAHVVLTAHEEQEQQRERSQHDTAKRKGESNETATAATNTINSDLRGDTNNSVEGLPLSADFKGILEGTVSSTHSHSQQSTMMHVHPRPLRSRSNQPAGAPVGTESGRNNNAPQQNTYSSGTATAAHHVPLTTVAANCKYTRLLPLGSGSYGEAWVIRRNSDSQLLAAKVMRLSTADRKKMQRAESEVQCLQACRHFACLSFVEHFQEGDRLLIIVEYCNAGDLASYINTCRQANQSPPEATIGIIILQLLLAVEHMHRKKIIHRDIKSQNVFLSTSGLVKVGDFGLSNEYDTISGDVANTFCGTPYYLAPEVWRRQRYGARADVWALGVIAYELITGRCPFTSNDMSGLAKRVETPHHPINAERHKVSQELVDLVDLMLIKEAKDRPRAIHLLMNTPYLRRQLNSFIPTVQNTDRVSPEMKALIASCVVDLEREMEMQMRRDIAAQERAIAMGLMPTAYIDGSPTNFSSPTSCVSGGDFSSNLCVNGRHQGGGVPPTGLQHPSHLHPSVNALYPSDQTGQFQQNRSMNAANVVSSRSSPSGPSNAGKSNVGLPPSPVAVGGHIGGGGGHIAVDPYAYEGPVRKYKENGKFVMRYLVLTSTTLEVLEDATKARNRRPLQLNRLKGADVPTPSQLGAEGCDTLIPLIDPSQAHNPVVRPFVRILTVVHPDGSGAQLQVPHQLARDCCMVIQTIDGHQYFFTADDREMWINAINEALGANDLQ